MTDATNELLKLQAEFGLTDADRAEVSRVVRDKLPGALREYGDLLIRSPEQAERFRFGDKAVALFNKIKEPVCAHESQINAIAQNDGFQGAVEAVVMIGASVLGYKITAALSEDIVEGSAKAVEFVLNKMC